jgi:hypothetical protein
MGGPSHDDPTRQSPTVAGTEISRLPSTSATDDSPHAAYAGPDRTAGSGDLAVQRPALSVAGYAGRRRRWGSPLTAHPGLMAPTDRLFLEVGRVDLSEIVVTGANSRARADQAGR